MFLAKYGRFFDRLAPAMILLMGSSLAAAFTVVAL
jgi:hypothetical protein